MRVRPRFPVLGQLEIERAGRYDKPLSALMIDLDAFKQVNDTPDQQLLAAKRE
jgi:two-component system, cell cycle response regulator